MLNYRLFEIVSWCDLIDLISQHVISLGIIIIHLFTRKSGKLYYYQRGKWIKKINDHDSELITNILNKN